MHLFAHIMFKTQNSLVEENASKVQKVIKMKKTLQTTTVFLVFFYFLLQSAPNYWTPTLFTEKQTLLTFKMQQQHEQKRLKRHSRLLFDAQISCRASTLVTQTSGSVYWPQVLVINIHDAGACAFPTPERLSFPDLKVNKFKVDAFSASLFDQDSPPTPQTPW